MNEVKHTLIACKDEVYLNNRHRISINCRMLVSEQIRSQTQNRITLQTMFNIARQARNDLDD